MNSVLDGSSCAVPGVSDERGAGQVVERLYVIIAETHAVAHTCS